MEALRVGWDLHGKGDPGDQEGWEDQVNPQWVVPKVADSHDLDPVGLVGWEEEGHLQEAQVRCADQGLVLALTLLTMNSMQTSTKEKLMIVPLNIVNGRMTGDKMACEEIPTDPEKMGGQALSI